MSVTVTKNFDLSKFRGDFHKELNLFGDIVSEDHSKRLQRGEGVDGGQMTPLKGATIARKGFNQILVNTGDMGNLVQTKATRQNQEVIINPGDKEKRNGVTNQEIGGFHQEGNANLPKRVWFGISKKAEKAGFKLMVDKLDKILRRL